MPTLPKLILTAALCATFGLPLLLPAQQAVTTPRTISMVIIDDGVNTVNYLGDVDAGIPETPFIPLYFLSDETPRRIDVPFANLSSLFRYRGPEVLTFYHSPPSPDPQLPKPSSAGSVTLPKGIKDIIVLLITEDFESRRFRMIPLDDSNDGFPENTIRVYNFSSAPIAFEAGEQRHSVDPRGMTFVQMESDEPYQRIRIARFNENNGQWRLAYNRYTRVQEGHRSTYLIGNHPSGNSGQLLVRKIQDPVQLRQINFQHSGGEPEEVDPPTDQR